MLVANIVCFLLQALTSNTSSADHGWFTKMIWLSIPDLARFQLWRPLTSMFAHANFSHIFWNMFGLWMFGRPVETALGRSRFFRLYIVSGLVGAFLWIVCNLRSTIPLLGASGAVFGVLAAAAVVYPNMQVLVFFVLPMKMRTFVICFAVLSAIMQYSGSQGGIAHLAHLGGMLGGYLFLRYNAKQSKRGFGLAATLRLWLRHLQRPNQGRPAATPPPPRRPNSGPYFVEHEKPEGDPLANIDPILDKIGKHGMKSLTPVERDMLDRARQKLKKDLP